MNLFISSNQNITKLSKMVKEYFSVLVKKKDTRRLYNSTSPYNNHLGRIVIFKCSNCKKSLVMVWQMPSLYNYPKHAVAEFILHYLNQQGKDSITKCLQCSSHTIDFYAELSVRTDHFYLFSIMIEVNDYSGLGYVIKCVFELLETFKAISSETCFDILWEEFVNVKKILFNFGEKLSPLDLME